MDNRLLEIKDLYVQYNTDEAVVHGINGVSLSVDRGDVLGLVGETGAGKTTLALSVLRLLPERVGEIKSGSIVYDGMDLTALSEHEMMKIRGARTSMIFQDPMTSLNPIITVGKQVREVLDLHYPDMSAQEKESKVDEMFRMVGILPSRKNEFPHQFSGGMKQRIGIAMALVAEPELLIADEPTTALDVTIQAQVMNLMRELKEKLNSTMILITHDLGVVAGFCEKVAVMYAGEIIEQGTVDEVFAREKNHPYTEGLFNSIPDLTTDSKRLTPIPGFMPDPTSLPEGCKFADRCPYCQDSCRQAAPGMAKISDTHWIKCLKYGGMGEE